MRTSIYTNIVLEFLDRDEDINYIYDKSITLLDEYYLYILDGFLKGGNNCDSFKYSWN